LGYLEKVSPSSISIVTFKTHPDWDQYLSQSRAQIVLGDARREELLEKAGIRKAQVIVIATDSDAHNISIAFDAVRLNPEVRVVLRLQHDDLALHLKDQIPNLDTWNPTALATPMFVRASLGENIIGEVRAGQSIRFIEEVSLAGLSGNELQVILQSTSVICGVSKDGKIKTAEEILLVGGVGVLKILVIRESETIPKFSAFFEGRFFRQIFHGHESLVTALKNIYQNFTDIPEQIKVLFGLIATVFISSIFIFRSHLSLDFFDSIYFVSTLMTTTGFGDINLENAEPWIKIYGSILMFFSLAMVAGLISFINDRMISVRFKNLVGPQFKNEKSHIIVSGLGPLGYSIIKELVSLGESVIGVSDGSKEDYSEDLRKMVPVIQGRELNVESLKRAQISRAKAVVMTSHNEIRNLADGLSAKKANGSARIVVRTLDVQLARKMNVSLPIDKVLSDSEVSATNFVASVLVKEALVGLEWQNHFIVLSRHSRNDKRPSTFQFEGSPLYVFHSEIKGTGV